MLMWTDICQSKGFNKMLKRVNEVFMGKETEDCYNNNIL